MGDERAVRGHGRDSRHRRFRVILSLVVTAALVACGGDEEPPSAADDKATAERIVLAEADLPGWTRHEVAVDEVTDPTDVALEECVNRNSLLVALMRLESARRGADTSFRSDDGPAVGSLVTFAEDESDAKAAFTELNRASFTRCLEGVLRTGLDAELGAHADLLEVSVSRLAVPDLGDDSTAYRGVVEIPSPTGPATASFDFVFLRVGRGLANLYVYDLGIGGFDRERNRLAEILAGRLIDA